MSLWRRLFRREPAPSTTHVAAFEAPRLAAPGTPRSASTLMTDRRLSARELACKVREIHRTEPRVASASAAFGANIARFNWSWEAGDAESPVARRNADYMLRLCGLGPRYRRGMLATPWSTVVANASKMRDGGFITAEVGTLRREDGAVWVRDVHFPAIDAIAPNPWHENTTGERIRVRAPAGLFTVDVEPGQLLSIGQMGANGESGTFECYRALHFRADPHGAEWDGGGGRIRPCVPWHDLAQLVYRVLAIGVERFGAGCVKVVEDRAKGRSQGYTDSEITTVTEGLLAVAEQLSAGSRTAAAEVAGSRLEYFDAGWNGAALLAVYEFAIGQMRAAYTASQLDLTEGGGGSYNGGVIASKNFEAQVGAEAQSLADTFTGRGPFQGTLFRGLVDTYGPQRTTDLPVCVVRGAVEPLWADWLKDIATIVQSGMHTTMPRSMKRIFRDIGMDPIDLDDMAATVAAAARDAGVDVPAEPPPSEALVQQLTADAIPAIPPGDYSSGNRDVAELLGMSTARVNSLVRRATAAGKPPPTIGRGRDRRWDIDRVYAWYEQVTGEDAP